jgi:outer membrane beta-barrel protein
VKPRALAVTAVGLAVLAVSARPAAADGADDNTSAKADAKPEAKLEAKADTGPRQPRTTELCIDQEIAERLAIKRKRRGAVDRLVVKAGRHELSVGGGYYASDLLSGTYMLSAAYTFHMTDETAVEFSGAYSHANADLVRALEDKRGVLLTDTFAPLYFAESLLVWSPIYGKLRFGGSVLHFDLHTDLGVGVVDAGTSRGASGVLGFGAKIFLNEAIALRIDARDRTFRQELLAEHFLVNDTAVTASLSVFFPFHN